METDKLSGLSPDELEGVLKNPASSAERKQQAAALLFVHYWPVLVAVAAHSLKGHRADEAVDVVQELFASALQSIVGSYDPAKGTSFLNFLRTCVRNRAISFARLAVFRRQKAINPTHLAAFTTSEPAAPETLSQQEEVRRVLDCLRPEVQAVFRRFYLEGRNAAEVAAELDVSVSWVYRQLHQGRETVRQRLAEQAAASTTVRARHPLPDSTGHPRCGTVS